MSKLDKIPEPEAMNGERYFQIREIRKDSRSYESFAVTGDTTEKEIMEIACSEWMGRMEKREMMYYPSIFREPPYWANTLTVIEQKRTILPPSDWHKERGKTFMNEWKTKRKGFRFKIARYWMTATFSDGSKRSVNSYRPLEDEAGKENEREGD